MKLSFLPLSWLLGNYFDKSGSQFCASWEIYLNREGVQEQHGTASLGFPQRCQTDCELAASWAKISACED